MSGGQCNLATKVTDPNLPLVSVGNGYLHRLYAESLAEFGTPRALPQSKGWILERPIPGTEYRDAMGCYPLFACQRWMDLKSDLDDMGDELVSMAVVTDPFGDYSKRDLEESFRDVVLPFKTHFVVDLTSQPDTFVHPHHLRNARKSLRVLTVSRCDDPAAHPEDWRSLYQNLIQRHNIRGIASFSDRSFAYLPRVPGTVMLRAMYGVQPVGMMWWLVDRNVGYYHLGAYSDLGYEFRASFALLWTSIEMFKAQGLQWLDLGGTIGTEDDTRDGLTRFKRGWSNATRMAYLCGRIFDAKRYEDLTKRAGHEGTRYFPAYRHGEFA
jgi:Acetyltransferase (GNAT) domain